MLVDMWETLQQENDKLPTTLQQENDKQPIMLIVTTLTGRMLDILATAEEITDMNLEYNTQAVASMKLVHAIIE